jgi:crotonobetainyl-CoA:carnitine CoA-transferase CaiB-like acyl-CoA transferase
MSGALSGLVVLDASESISGQFCGRLFADHGADVTLIEPPGGPATESPGGSALRRMGPFDPAPGGGVGSMLFFHLNLGKRSVTLDLREPAGRGALLERAKSADIVIAGNHIDAEALRAANPACIVCVVSDFGEDGPYRDWRGSEMIFQALSGIMFNNGDEGREPLYGVGHRACYAAGVGAYIATLTALHARHRLGQGQTVRLDVAHNTAAMGPPNTLMYNYSGMMEERGNHYSPFGVLRCSDGWVGMWVYPHTFEPMCRVLECPELMTDPRFDTPKQRVVNWNAMVEEVQSRVLRWTSDDVLDRLHKGRLVAAKAYMPSQLYRGNAHLEARRYWDTVDTPSGPAPILGPSFRMSATPRAVRGPAPAPGQDNHAAPAPAKDKGVRKAAQAGASSNALEGLRVVEFTTAWAGPMAGRICAFFGAEVIHVESATRLDVWRQNNSVFLPRRYAGGIPGERPYNRVGYFNSQNMNKLSLTLDIKDARGREAMRRLLDQTDVVVCNFTAGTLARMGFGYEALSATNPGIIVVEMPGFGNTGPLSKCTANGATMELASGMSALIGYPGGAPTTTGQVYPDPMGGFNAAAAILTALTHRDRNGTGRGQYVEVPQVEASMQFIGEELLHAIATGEDPRPHGNRVRWAAPHDAYLAAGEDQWVAIAVETDAEWRALCGLMGRPDLAGDARYATFEARWRNQDALRDPISAWTRTLGKRDIAARLQAAGVRAAPVLDPREVTEDPYLAHRDFFVELTHPEAGTHRYPSLPFRLSLTPGAQHRASPCLGADTRRILTGIGLSEAEVDELDRDGVTSAIPAKKNAA